MTENDVLVSEFYAHHRKRLLDDLRRVDTGLSLEQVANRLNISCDVLKAIEAQTADPLFPLLFKMLALYEKETKHDDV